MEGQRQETREAREIAGEAPSLASAGEPDGGEVTTPGAFQSFRALLDKARQNQKPVASRRDLSRDKSKSLLVLVGVSVALLLVFFGLFSNPKGRRSHPNEQLLGTAAMASTMATVRAPMATPCARSNGWRE